MAPVAVDQACVAAMSRDEYLREEAADIRRCEDEYEGRQLVPRRKTVTHELRTWPQSFVPLVEGRMHHQIRRRDRPFAVGDKLVLREWDPKRDPNLRYTGRVVTATVSYLSMPATFGLPDDVCVMSLVGIGQVS